MNINNISSDILLECISRSGLCPLDETGGDGSTFSLIISVCVNDMINDRFNLEDSKSVNKLIQEFVNKFMVLHHNIVVKSKKFNWNWD